jgi:hypothetical protein
LEAWEIDLLFHLTLEVDPFSICLETHRGFRAVSDGSVLPTGNASFGWILSNRRGEHVKEDMGQRKGDEFTLIGQKRVAFSLAFASL